MGTLITDSDDVSVWEYTGLHLVNLRSRFVLRVPSQRSSGVVKEGRLDPRFREGALLLDLVRQLGEASLVGFNAFEHSSELSQFGQMVLSVPNSTVDLPMNFAGHHQFLTWSPLLRCVESTNLDGKATRLCEVLTCEGTILSNPGDTA